MDSRRAFQAAVVFGAIAALVAVKVCTRAMDRAPKPGKPGAIAWRQSVETGLGEAAKSRKVVFVDFSATWCSPCQEMLKTTYKNPQVVAFSRRVVPVLIDIDKSPETAEKYKVDGIPALLFLDSRGNVLVRDEGYHDTAAFLSLGNRALRLAAPADKKGKA